MDIVIFNCQINTLFDNLCYSWFFISYVIFSYSHFYIVENNLQTCVAFPMVINVELH
jgi:hypothetical protein